MKTDHLNAAAQILTFIAVVLGLGLVVYELRQSARVADATMYNMTIDRVNNRLLTRVGEDPRAAMFKVAVCPKQLDGEDLVTLDMVYKLYIISLAHEAQVANTLNLERDVDAPVHGIVGQYFDNEPAQRWLKYYLEVDSPLDSVPGLKASILSELEKTNSDVVTERRAYAALAGRELNCDNMRNNDGINSD